MAKRFCETQVQGSSCFADLPAHLQDLINEYYAAVGRAGTECVCEAPTAEFTRFAELPVPVQKKIIKFCLPSGQTRYLENPEVVGEDSTSTLLQTIPCAAKANRLFYGYFLENWKRSIMGTEQVSGVQKPPIRTFVNFSLDKIVIDISRPLGSMSAASYLIQHQSNQRPGSPPMRLSETWAHGKAETEIRPLPDALFAKNASP